MLRKSEEKPLKYLKTHRTTSTTKPSKYLKPIVLQILVMDQNLSDTYIEASDYVSECIIAKYTAYMFEFFLTV